MHENIIIIRVHYSQQTWYTHWMLHSLTLSERLVFAGLFRHQANIGRRTSVDSMLANTSAAINQRRANVLCLLVWRVLVHMYNIYNKYICH